MVNYLHYRDNGEIDPVYIDTVGVGRYDAAGGVIEAENYFNTTNTQVKECPEGGFEVVSLSNGSALYYPNVFNLKASSEMAFRYSSPLNITDGLIEIHEDNPKGKLLGKVKIQQTKEWQDYTTTKTTLQNKAGKVNLCLVFKGKEGELLHLNWIKF